MKKAIESEQGSAVKVAAKLFEEPTKASQLEQDVSVIKKDVATNTANIAAIQKDVATNTTNIAVMQKDVARNTSDIADIKNTVLENSAGINKILGLLEGEEKASKKESERRDTVKTWIAAIGITVSLILGIVGIFT